MLILGLIYVRKHVGSKIYSKKLIFTTQNLKYVCFF